MSDLQIRLEEYAAEIDAVEPVTVAEILERAEEPRPVRPWVPGLVAAAVTILLIVWIAPADLLPGGDTEPADQPSVTSTTVPTTTSAAAPATTVAPTSTTTIPSEQTFTWDVVFEGAFGEAFGQINAVTTFGDRLMAVGYEGDLSDGVVWVSNSDGTWTRITLFDGEGWQDANDVVVAGDELVVVGTSEDGSALVAVSADGISWETISVEADDPGADPVGMTAVAVRSGLLVAVGTDIWTSTDGRVWTLTLDLPRQIQAKDVVANDRGIVVVGVDFSNGADPVAWWSTDGAVWTDVSPEPRWPEGWKGWIYGVAATPDGFLAGGGGTTDPGISPTGGLAASDAALWTSQDGTSWRRVDDDRANLGGGGGQWVESLISFDDIVVAVGVHMGTNWQIARGVVWESHDGGASWQRSDDPDAVFGSYYGGYSAAYDVIEDGNRLIAVGQLESVPAMWIGTPTAGP